MKGRERKKKGFGERGKSSTLSNYEFSSSIKSYDSTTSVRSNISRGGVGGLSSVTSSRQYTLESGRRNSALDCMLKCCFRSNYSLRFQLFLSFGIVTLVSIGFVMLIAILTSIESGIFVRSLSRDNLENWASRNVEEGSRYIAETITQKLSTLEGLSRILKETTQERFMGYPNHPLYYNDGLVPFTDIYTKQHRYPLKASDKNKLPLEWNYQQNVNPQNAQEHLQHRYDWYQDHQVGTASAAFRMQGACDPSVTDTQSSLYYHNCTQHNNDMTTGGIIAPTLTLESIHSKTSDYATAVLKPLYEYHKDVAILGIYFANDGAGAVTVFPSFPLDGRRNFTSAGCEFLRQPNPHNNNSENRTIGTQEQINRCHKKGDNVNQRDYNPLERTWCQTMALDPSKVHSIGPYEDAIRGDGLLTFGQGIYDKVTNEFIGCTLADISVDQFKHILEDVKLTNSTKIALVRWNEEGTVVASTGWGNNFVPGNVVNVTNLDGISLESFQAKKDLFQTSWQNEDFDSTQFRSSLSFGGHYFAGFPVPVPPKEYDPAYRPEFMLILSVTKDEVLGTVDRLDDEIDSRVENLILWSLVGGFLGIVFVLLIIHFVSIYLTQPMNWMNSVGDGIVRSYGEQGPIIPPSESSWWRYAPKTEITALVVEFQSMIEKFSGSGTAKLHRQREMEIQNPFDLISNFTTLYESRNATRLKYNYDDPAASGFHDSTNDSKFTMGMPWRKHWGPNIHCVTEEEKEEEEVSTSSGSLRRLTGEQDKRVVKSRLFWWIFGSIAIPLLATMLAIAAYVAYRISQSMPDVSHEVERAYIDLEVGSLDSIVRIRAAYAAEVVSSYIRDLHVYYRIMGWLLFGALERSDSFTSMTSLTEQCKDQEEGKCNYDPNLAVCDCKWKDRWGYACQHYDHDTREYQNMWFINNVEDAMPNGDRLNTSFPKVGDDPTTTAWIGSAEDAAGASKGVNASGYDTTYERLRIQSAASMIAIPLLNYVHGTSLVGSTGVYSAFERDGSLMGYSGCEHYHTNAAFFFSDEESVHKNSTHLCPYGKYG